MKISTLIILVLFVGCSLSKKGAIHRINIDIDLVDFISIKKEVYKSDSIYFLTKEEIKVLSNEWNNSEFKGIYKMIPVYGIRVHLKNDSIRSFVVNKNLIKENSDWTYSFSNTKLISSLWKNAEAIPPPPPLFMECDSINQKAKKDYQNGIREYIVLGTVYMTDFEMFYSNFMKKTHNIIIKANCSPSMIEESYAESMMDEIEKEYGENFIQLSRKNAEIEFSKRPK